MVRSLGRLHCSESLGAHVACFAPPRVSLVHSRMGPHHSSSLNVTAAQQQQQPSSQVSSQPALQRAATISTLPPATSGSSVSAAQAVTSTPSLSATRSRADSFSHAPSPQASTTASGTNSELLALSQVRFSVFNAMSFCVSLPPPSCLRSLGAVLSVKCVRRLRTCTPK